VNYRNEKRDGNFTKIPYQIDNVPASSTNTGTWNDFESVVKAYQLNRFDGIGFVVTPTDAYCGIDLDHCRNPETGEIEPDKLAIVNKFNSHAEITPSNLGVRVWIKAKLPGEKKRNDKIHIEIYDSARFFTVTGNHLEGTPRTIENRQNELNSIYYICIPCKFPFI
jgi:putative DNA primase/helicase